MANCQQLLQDIVQAGMNRPYLMYLYRGVGNFYSYGDGVMSWNGTVQDDEPERLTYTGHFTAVWGDIVTRPQLTVEIFRSTGAIAISDPEHGTITSLSANSATCDGDVNSLQVTGQEVLGYGQFPGSPPKAEIRLTGLNIQGLSLPPELLKQLIEVGA